MAIIVKSNFFEDIRAQASAWFTSAGITLPDPNNLEAVLFAYFSVKRRLISMQPRQVMRSRELQSRALSEVEKQALDMIEKQTMTGEALMPRLSKSIMRPDFNDGLLDDWGIHHLHLGNKIGQDGFFERGDPLLYVLVRADAVHFIDLLDHSAFEDDQLLQIIHENWPEKIALFRVPGTVPGSLSPQLSPEDRRKARKRLTVTWQASDGTIYLPPGGGATTAGLGSQVVSAADHLLEKALAAEKWSQENAEWFRDAIAKKTGKHLDELHFTFQLHEPENILETQSKTLYRLPFEEPTRASVQL